MNLDTVCRWRSQNRSQKPWIGEPNSSNWDLYLGREGRSITSKTQSTNAKIGPKKDFQSDRI